MFRLLPLLLVLACATEADPGPVDPNAPPGALPPPDCSAAELRGEVYDCDVLDRCDNSAENLAYRDACCRCDPRLCQEDLTCPG
ncbi:MAG: hypothetical protein R3F61_37940 [Myxococcota bacterium]